MCCCCCLANGGRYGGTSWLNEDPQRAWPSRPSERMMMSFGMNVCNVCHACAEDRHLEPRESQIWKQMVSGANRFSHRVKYSRLRSNSWISQPKALWLSTSVKHQGIAIPHAENAWPARHCAKPWVFVEAQFRPKANRASSTFRVLFHGDR